MNLHKKQRHLNSFSRCNATTSSLKAYFCTSDRPSEGLKREPELNKSTGSSGRLSDSSALT